MIYDPKPSGTALTVSVADYASRGPDAVAAAIAAAQTRGVRQVYVPPGQYVSNSFSVASGIILFGEGAASQLLFVEAGPVDFIQLFGQSEFVIRDLLIDKRRDLQVHGVTGETISLSYSNNGLISGVITRNSTQDCIDLDDSEFITIRDCVCLNSAKAGIHISHNSTHNWIVNNYVGGAGSMTAARGGITQVNNASRNHYFGNVVVNGGNRGFDILAPVGGEAEFGRNISEDNALEDVINGPDET